MSIAILCPTRGRPDKFLRMVASAYDKTCGVYVYAGYDENPKGQNHGYGWDSIDTYERYFPENMPTAQKWNSLAEYAMTYPDTTHKLFMLGADDMVFDTPGWDRALLDHYNALDNKIHCYALQDSRSCDGTPHPIVTREWVEAMGYFMPPIFLHWFLDTWTVAIAKANGVFTHMKDYSLIHDKPSDRGQPDETHSRIRQWGFHERDKWVNEHCQHFLELEKRRLADALRN